jgi:molybdopterin converting factor small subunit
METLKVNFYSWAAKMLWEEPGEGKAAQRGDRSRDLPVPASGTLQGLLEELAARYPLFATDIYDPASARLNPRVSLFLNGRSISSAQGLQTPLKAGDLLAVVPIAEGG